MTDKSCLVLGAGGHALVVIEALRSAGWVVEGCLDPRRDLSGVTINGAPVLGGDEVLDRHVPGSVALVNAVGAGTDTAARRALYERLSAKGHLFPPVVSAHASCFERSSLGPGCQLLTKCVVQTGASIGANAIVNTAAVVANDARVGAHAFLGPGVIVCSGAVVEEGAFIGVAAIVLPGIRVGAGAHVAAGAVVLRDVPAGGRARGVHLLKEAAQ